MYLGTRTGMYETVERFLFYFISLFWGGADYISQLEL